MKLFKNKGLSQTSLIFACGCSLFSDGYVNAVSGPVMTIITGYLYPDHPNLSEFQSNFSALVFAGTVLGMLVFGLLTDRIGRKFGMIFASLWLTLFSILIAGAWGAGGSVGGLFAALQAYRFLQGIAIGAEYPCGSVAASENTEHESVKTNRQQMYFTLATNSMIDVGFVLAYFVALILLWIFGMGHLEWVWRLSLGLGAIPPLTVLYFRVKMDEPEHYQKGAIKKNIPWLLIFKRYWVRLTAICIAWFAYDYVTYPSSIYSSLIVKQVMPDGGTLYKQFGWSTLLNVFYLPGTFIGAMVNDRLGPKNTMLIGLTCQCIMAFIMGGAFSHIRQSNAAFIIVYGLFLSFGEFGSGNNLGLLASKACGPTAVRGTFYGIAAAIGKVGAFSGSYAYPKIQADLGPPGSNIYNAGPFYIAGGLAAFTIFVVYFFIPPVVPDGMKIEDEKFRQYLIENNYDVSFMGLKGDAQPPAGLEEGTASDNNSERPSLDKRTPN